MEKILDSLRPLQSQEKEGGKQPYKVDYNVLVHLRRLLASLSICDTLMMSPKLRETLVKALLELKVFLAYFTKKNLEEAQYLKVILGVSKDLFLCTSNHNLPLYVLVIVNGTKWNYILVDPRALVHIVNVKTLAHLI